MTQAIRKRAWIPRLRASSPRWPPLSFSCPLRGRGRHCRPACRADVWLRCEGSPFCCGETSGISRCGAGKENENNAAAAAAPHQPRKARQLIRALKVAYSLMVVCSFRSKAPSALHPPPGALDSASLKGKPTACVLQYKSTWEVLNLAFPLRGRWHGEAVTDEV